MTIEEELTYIAAAKTGDEAAAALLVDAYEPLMKHAAALANKRGFFTLYEDALGTARLAFWRCVLEYEPERGANFAAYVKLRVVGAVKDFLRQSLSHGDNLPLEYAENVSAPPEDAQLDLPPMTEAEAKVFSLLAAGYKEREIATALRRSQQAVSKTKMRLRKKFRRYLAEECAIIRV